MITKERRSGPNRGLSSTVDQYTAQELLYHCAQALEVVLKLGEPNYIIDHLVHSCQGDYGAVRVAMLMNDVKDGVNSPIVTQRHLCAAFTVLLLEPLSEVCRTGTFSIVSEPKAAVLAFTLMLTQPATWTCANELASLWWEEDDLDNVTTKLSKLSECLAWATFD
jgi:hypothetical protein